MSGKVIQSRKPSLSVFLSYSHQDEIFRDDLEKHLAVLKRQGYIHTWYDRRIIAGEEWEKLINENLLTADIILLLVSSDFIASEYCYNIELKTAMERHQSGTAWVIPIIVRPVAWKDTPFANLQPLPTDAKPITLWRTADEAWTDVVEGLQKVVNLLKRSGPDKLVKPPKYSQPNSAQELLSRRKKGERYFSGARISSLRPLWVFLKWLSLPLIPTAVILLGILILTVLNRFVVQPVILAKVTLNFPMWVNIIIACVFAVLLAISIMGLLVIIAASLAFMNELADKPNFIRADLSGVHLGNADLRWADFSGANLEGTIFINADLRWANLEGADLSMSDLSGANLYGANLKGTKLVGAKLFGTNLAESNFDSSSLQWTRYNNQTIWPTHFVSSGKN